MREAATKIGDWPGGPEHPSGDEARAAVVAGLSDAADRLRREGVPTPTLEGKLLRPLVAYGLVPPEYRRDLGVDFWCGALAVQMAHEASLLHDDILDGAETRRGSPTLQASHGSARALVLGDHLLTGSYRAAAASGAPSFLICFIDAVERTVAGEIAQGRSAGRALAAAEYREIVAGKSGELFGAATSLWGCLRGAADKEERRRLGRELGILYQQVDDLLDYCPAADTGKPPLQDYRQGKWTFVLDLAPVTRFDLTHDEVVQRLFGPMDGGPSAARRALTTLHRSRGHILASVERLSPGDGLLAQVVDGWIRAAERGVAAQEKALFGTEGHQPSMSPPAGAGGTTLSSGWERSVRREASLLGGHDGWREYFGHHARTFHLAARLFPAEPRALVTGVYAYCRFTDDLVDQPRRAVGPGGLEARLRAWRALSLEALSGASTGVPVLDEVLGEAARRGVDPAYVRALLDGVAADLTPTVYPDWAALDAYAFQVAGAVGGWVTQLFGFRDPELLRHAHDLGKAMQLTNIARDVGEDLRRGRVYLPLDLLEGHGLSPSDLAPLLRGTGLLPDGYRAAMEELLSHAEDLYDRARPGVRALPGWYRRPVAAAAEAYRGIHREIRRRGYDNLRVRAATTLARKILLAAAGLARSGL